MVPQKIVAMSSWWFLSGSQNEIIPKDCTGFWFLYKAHPLSDLKIMAEAGPVLIISSAL